MRIVLLTFLIYFTLFGNTLDVETKDGFDLKAELLYPEIAVGDEEKTMFPLAVFLHGLGENRAIWSELSEVLREKGFATLEIDMRGHGESTMQNGKPNNAQISALDAEKISPHGKESQKVGLQNIPTDIAQFLETMYETEHIDVENLLFIGDGLGAVSFIPLLQDYRPKAAILLYGSSIEFFGKNAKDSLSESQTPILFVSSEENLKIGVNYLKRASNLSLLTLQKRVPPIEIEQLLVAYIRQYFDLKEQEKQN